MKNCIVMHLFTHFNRSLKTKKMLSLLLIRWMCFRSSHQKAFSKKILLKLFCKSIYKTLLELLCVYNSAKDELLLEYFRRKYLYPLMATFGISRQLVSTLKHYCDKKLSLVETTLKKVCF